MRQACASRDVNGLKWGEAEKALQQDVLTCEVLSPLVASAFPWLSLGRLSDSPVRHLRGWHKQLLALQAPSSHSCLFSLLRAQLQQHKVKESLARNIDTEDALTSVLDLVTRGHAYLQASPGPHSTSTRLCPLHSPPGRDHRH
jgi:hypothetical protein